MNTTNDEMEDHKKMNDLINRASNLLTKKQTMEQPKVIQQSPEHIAYWNNVWKQCDKLGTSFSSKVQKQFHNQIYINIDDAKRLLWDIIKTLEPKFEFTDHNKPVLNELILYFTGDPSFNGDLSKGICLYGKRGSGKTFIMTCFMAFAQQLNYRKFYCYHCDEVALKLKEHMQYLDRYTLYPAMLDDLMSEDKIVDYGNVIDTMKFILKIRERNNIVTHSTTNINPTKAGEIESYYGDRIESRFHSMFNFIHLHSKKDYRKT